MGETNSKKPANSLRQTVHNSEDDGVPIGWGKPSHKVHGSQGWWGIGRGLSRPARGWCDVFPPAHIGQAAMKDSASWTMDGHKKHCLRRWRVRERPGWKVSRDEQSVRECLHGTVAHTMQKGERPEPESEPYGSAENWQDRASGFTFWEPGW